MNEVIKRDGRKVPFDETKIENAILKAFISVDGKVTDFAKTKAKNIATYISTQEGDMSIEDIQDMVENGLMSTKRKDVARAYITYRYDRSKAREKNTILHKNITEKLMASHVVNQNANVDERSFGGRKGEASSVYNKNYALNFLMSPLARYNHLHNIIYTHDLDSYAVGEHNCLSCPIDDLLAKGFKVRNRDIRPARSINTALQLLAVIFQLQSLDQFGGVSATHLDWSLVPYLKYSFRKHYIVNYIESTDEFFDLDLVNMSMEEIDDWCDSVQDKYLKEMGLTKDDFYFDNDKLDPKLYKKAYYETKKELYQAVEAMYHNLSN